MAEEQQPVEQTNQQDNVVPATTLPPQAQPRKSGMFVPIAIAVVATFIFVLLLDGHFKNKKPDIPPRKPRPVKTLVATPVDGALTLKYPGKTRAAKQVEIGFQVSGSLIDLSVNSGDVVKKDQVLARLDPRDFQNTLEARNADYLNAKLNLERQQKLFASATIPKSKLDDAVAAFKVAEASKNIAEKSRQDCILKAPFDGVVAKRYVDNFQSVTQGSAVISLQDLSSLEIEVDFPEWLVAKARSIAQSTVATATYDSLPGKTIALRVREFAAEADPQTRTYPVRFSMLDNPDAVQADILPGMTASVQLVLTPKQGSPSVFRLPVWSVVSDGKDAQPYVYIVKDEKQTPWTVIQRKVKLGEMAGDSVLIKEGLQEGDRVIVAGASQLENGFAVRDLPLFIKAKPAPAETK